jgi:hypothetical protein
MRVRLSPEGWACIQTDMANLTEFSLAEALALLDRTPATLSALLRGLPDIWVRRNEKGEARQFDPFDRLAQFEESQGKSLDQLLDDFARLRRDNLAALQTLNLQHEDWARRGKHPSLGVVMLSELVATWAVHDLTHIHQLSRVMAHQYRDAVGPWSAYLGVLQCAGHSA